MFIFACINGTINQHSREFVSVVTDSCFSFRSIHLLLRKDTEQCLFSGTLHYVMMTSRFDFTDPMKYSMALDIAHGLKYLHLKHFTLGFLSSISCYVDNTWCVQIADWHMLPIITSEDSSQLEKLIARPAELTEEALIMLLYGIHKSRKNQTTPAISTPTE